MFKVTALHSITPASLCWPKQVSKPVLTQKREEIDSALLVEGDIKPALTGYRGGCILTINLPAHVFFKLSMFPPVDFLLDVMMPWDPSGTGYGGRTRDGETDKLLS